jgi:pyridoxal phosphate enzyme (YggS family)
VTAAQDDEGRRAELVSAVGAVRARIAAACEAAGRDPHSVTLVAVTKTYPARDVATLVRLGIQDVGESKDQEARAKVADTAALLPGGPTPTWHFVGQVQSRKARSVASYADAVHSVDRPKLVDALAAAAREVRDRPLAVFVQVSLDGDPTRGGVPVAGLPALTDAVAACPELRLRGLMAVPPLGSDAEEQFARLAELASQVRQTHPDADALSAGMSSDLEAAVRHGSTHVRVGTALLGRRPPVFG